MDRVINGTSALLINDYPLMVLPQLAVLIGLNEAIILQQVHYWTKEIYNKLSRGKYIHNVQDNYIWVYNSYPQWQKQFPFWSYDTVKRTIRSLEEKNVLIIGNYNILRADKTKWYRINYNTLDELMADKNKANSVNCTVLKSNLPQPIPEITPENTNNKNNNGLADTEVSPRLPGNFQINLPQNTQTKGSFPKSVNYALGYYFREYEAILGKKHPYLKAGQMERVKETLASLDEDIEEDGWEMMINQWFSKEVQTDYNINHFATETILQNLFYEVLY